MSISCSYQTERHRGAIQIGYDVHCRSDMTKALSISTTSKDDISLQEVAIKYLLLMRRNEDKRGSSSLE